jgi:aspartate/methionine/tyrosine aminotransferase
MNPQAEELNQILLRNNPSVLDMLAERGKEIFFPAKGILAQSADAKGKEINVTIGIAQEEDNSPMALPSLAKMIPLPATDVFTYAPSFGKPELRKLWLEKMRLKNPSLNNRVVSLPVVTCALTHGLSISGYLFLDKGDTLLSPDLYWENYRLIFENSCNASISHFTTFTENGAFHVQAMQEAIRKQKSNKTVLLLNFPNNPTGYTITVSEAKEIVRVLTEEAEKGKKLVVIVDDAYFGLVYEEGIIRESIFSQLSQAHKNILAVKLDGPTKEDYVWGFRVGFITFGIKDGNAELYKALENKTGGAVRGSISNVSHLAQSMLCAAYTKPDYEKEKWEKFEILKKRYLKIKDILDKHPEYKTYFKPFPFNSGYFMCLQLVKNLDSEKVRQTLLQKYSVGVVAEEGILRIAFSSTPYIKLEPLFERIYQACKDVQG